VPYIQGRSRSGFAIVGYGESDLTQTIRQDRQARRVLNFDNSFRDKMP